MDSYHVYEMELKDLMDISKVKFMHPLSVEEVTERSFDCDVLVDLITEVSIAEGEVLGLNHGERGGKFYIIDVVTDDGYYPNLPLNNLSFQIIMKEYKNGNTFIFSRFLLPQYANFSIDV